MTPDYLAIVMEFANGGDMFQLVVANRGLPEQDARWYFQQLIIAVDYCHKMVQYTFGGAAPSACHPCFMSHLCLTQSLVPILTYP